MHQLNGSTHILRSDLVKVPDFNSTDWQDYHLFTDHGWIKDRILELYDEQIEPVPFPAVVYLIHKANISSVSSKHFNFSFKNILKKVLRGVWLSNKLKIEFSIAGK
jgi:hypothetical protein